MRKISLDVNDLVVESFVTVKNSIPTVGTVKAAQCQDTGSLSGCTANQSVVQTCNHVGFCLPQEDQTLGGDTCDTCVGPTCPYIGCMLDTISHPTRCEQDPTCGSSCDGSFTCAGHC